ncbi:MAG: hypothetical protein HC804_12545 [Anaerolineae bacterium]|nr:hypothetical protein [Anaerolineae bacterium]
MNLTTRLSLAADEQALLAAAAPGLSEALGIPTLNLYRYEHEGRNGTAWRSRPCPCFHNLGMNSLCCSKRRPMAGRWCTRFRFSSKKA